MGNSVSLDKLVNVKNDVELNRVKFHELDPFQKRLDADFRLFHYIVDLKVLFKYFS